MNHTLSIFRRELYGYFASPVAYVFIAIFLGLAGFATFSLGSFYEGGQADLRAFFAFHPWLYLFLVPSISMRLWAEERKQGTIELLMTLPISMPQAVMGKFLASWVFAGVCLLLTFPIWITVNYLGEPDNAVICGGYLGSFLMAGSYLAIGSCISATTKNQVIAFVVSVVVCLLFMLSGLPPVLDFFTGWAPDFLIDAVASFSFITHFESLTKGVIDVRNIVFFGSLIAFWLFANAIVIDIRKAE